MLRIKGAVLSEKLVCLIIFLLSLHVAKLEMVMHQ